MRVTIFPCGPAANESELKAIERLKSGLQSEPGNADWVLLTNLAFSVTHQLQSDEIDIVAIGPAGVRVIEVKHWSPHWFDAHEHDEVAREADRVTNKARKIGTTLRKIFSELPRVDGAILLTQEPSKLKRLVGKEVRGVRLHTLNDWKGALGLGTPSLLSPNQVMNLSRVLEPKSAVAMDAASIKPAPSDRRLGRRLPRGTARAWTINRALRPFRSDKPRFAWPPTAKSAHTAPAAQIRGLPIRSQRSFFWNHLHAYRRPVTMICSMHRSTRLLGTPDVLPTLVSQQTQK
ncbi:MAG TPA: nuclease-related domain-containing protein [Pirellulales bacterium]|nr:nuclease-related domain-containing protein [Pirellulales bacterium]